MNITSIQTIYFSPTQTTKKILHAITQGMQAVSIADIDLTFFRSNGNEIAVQRDQLAVIGSPVYGGRVPLPVISKLRGLRGNGGPAVVVVVYGNRAYEDALIELRDIAATAGFTVCAAAAFIGEHSYSRPETPVAAGRPDDEDLAKALAFGRQVRDTIAVMTASEDIASLPVPGSHPYKERGGLANVSPDTIQELCIKCGQCEDACPTGVVVVGDAVTTDKNGCIRCCACVKICPTRARVMRDPRVLQIVEQLTVKCRARKEPETYIATGGSTAGE